MNESDNDAKTRQREPRPDRCEPNNVLVTGAAGFIGCEVALALLERGDRVHGIDNLSDYYDVALKQARLERLESAGDSETYEFSRIDITEGARLDELFRNSAFDRVVHLAAQPGVRASIANPRSCIDNNVVGFLNVLEACRTYDVEHLVYASSSSVYGANTTMPYAVGDDADHPLSLYAASKRSNELMAHVYAHLFGLPVTGLRFFTVYGPWGRPDMAPMLFARAMLEGKPIRVYNYGRHQRDFTYVDDIVEAVLRVVEQPPPESVPWRVYNIGNNRPVELERFIAILEQALGVKAQTELLPLQPGDALDTCADVEPLKRDFGFRPKTTLEDGIARFATWFRKYHGGQSAIAGTGESSSTSRPRPASSPGSPADTIRN